MKYVIILFLFTSFVATAQEAATPSVTTKKRRPLPPRQWHSRLGFSMWQESLRVRSAADTAKMETQSQGLIGSFVYMAPLGSRAWLQSYSIDLGYGVIKGKGNSTLITDELKGQPWIMGGFTPGVIYRSSPVSQIGLMVPLAYRQIEWKLANGTEFNPDGDDSFSIGLSGAYINQLTRSNSLHLAVTYHTNWAATMWTASWQYRFL